MMPASVLAIVAGIGASALAVAALLRLAHRLPLAHPNERSLHGAPVPRVGGLALWAGFVPAALLAGAGLPGGLAGWLPAFAALALVSLADDVRGVAVPVRFLVHALAAVWTAVMVWRVPGGALPGVSPGAGYALAIVATALAIAWASNLYNFMDGSDGLAGATTLIGFGALGFAAQADAPLRIAGLGLAAASLPFLAVNRPPARLFLGDVGAVPAGYLAATLGIGGAVRGDWPLWFPLLVFLPFAMDATATLLRRLVRGEPVWRAHRSHYYQRLHQLGAGHAGTLAVYAACTAGTAVTALACLARAPELGARALLAWSIALACLFASIDYHWRKKTAPR